MPWKWVRPKHRGYPAYARRDKKGKNAERMPEKRNKIVCKRMINFNERLIQPIAELVDDMQDDTRISTEDLDKITGLYSNLEYEVRQAGRRLGCKGLRK